MSRPPAWRRRAREAAAQAVKANPRLSAAQFVVAYVNWLLDWNWVASEAGFREAIRLDPGDAAAHADAGARPVADGPARRSGARDAPRARAGAAGPAESRAVV